MSRLPWFATPPWIHRHLTTADALPQGIDAPLFSSPCTGWSPIPSGGRAIATGIGYRTSMDTIAKRTAHHASDLRSLKTCQLKAAQYRIVFDWPPSRDPPRRQTSHAQRQGRRCNRAEAAARHRLPISQAGGQRYLSTCLWASLRSWSGRPRMPYARRKVHDTAT